MSLPASYHKLYGKNCSILPVFLPDVRDNITEWKKSYDSAEPHALKYPSPWDALSGLDKMVVLRTLRPDKMVPSAQVGGAKIE